MSRGAPSTTPSTYSLLDFGDGRRLEQWGDFRLVRPDAGARGRAVMGANAWREADATYLGEKGKGAWEVREGRGVPAEWRVGFDDVRLNVRLAPYKHTGVFPEQLQNWRWMREVMRARASGEAMSVLNLFAYTGGATVALVMEGARVTHVDASRPAIAWAKQNALLNELPGDRVRWILDDVPAFVARERRRGRRYDAIILDPPAFGHGAKESGGKAWRVERDLEPLLEDCCALLSERAAFLVLNGYARNETAERVRELLQDVLRGRRVEVEARELRLAAVDGRGLSTGVVGRCAFG